MISVFRLMFVDRVIECVLELAKLATECAWLRMCCSICFCAQVNFKRLIHEIVLMFIWTLAYRKSIDLYLPEMNSKLCLVYMYF